MRNSARSIPAARRRLLELLVFIFLILPSLLLSFAPPLPADSDSVGFTLGEIIIIFRDLALACLVLFFIWRNREPAASIGWSPRRPLREMVLGLILYPAMFVVAVWVHQVARAAGFSTGSTALPTFLMPRGAGQIVLAVVMVAVVAVTEETIFRGYLILRLTAITGSTGAAVLLSSFIFSLGHGYQGAAGVVTVGAMGLIFALVYVWRKSLLAPIVMHFMQDLIGVVLAPALGLR